MTHHFTFVLFFGLVSLTAQPLDFKIHWGQEFDGPKRSTLHDIVGYDANGVYAIRVRYGTTEADTYSLERYDNHFKPIYSTVLEIVEDGERARIQTVLSLKNNLYVFYVVRDRARHKNELFARRINKNTLEPEDPKFKLGEAVEGKFSKEIKLKFKTSRDSSKVAVSYEYQAGWSERKSYGFFVIDENLRPMWKPNGAAPYDNELFQVENFKVDNAGNVYVLGIVFNDKRITKREGLPDYHYEILAWSGNGEVRRTYPVVLEDRFLTDMQIEVIDTKTLVCAGFYSTKGTYSIRGTYFLTVDIETKNIRTSSFKEFEHDFIMENLSEEDANDIRRNRDDGEPELFEYNLDNLLVGKDGSAILVGEQYFIEEESFTNRTGHIVTTRYYHYNDIIAVKIDPRGQIQWAEKVAKTQRTINDGGFSSSYILAIVNGKICFLFNDHPSNLKYNGTGRPMPYDNKDSIVILASLNQRGEQTRQTLFVARNVVITRPRACKQVSNHSVVLFGQWMTKQQLASVEFE